MDKDQKTHKNGKHIIDVTGLLTDFKYGMHSKHETVKISMFDTITGDFYSRCPGLKSEVGDLSQRKNEYTMINYFAMSFLVIVKFCKVDLNMYKFVCRGYFTLIEYLTGINTFEELSCANRICKQNGTNNRGQYDMTYKYGMEYIIKQFDITFKKKLVNILKLKGTFTAVKYHCKNSTVKKVIVSKSDEFKLNKKLKTWNNMLNKSLKNITIAMAIKNSNTKMKVVCDFAIGMIDYFRSKSISNGDLRDWDTITDDLRKGIISMMGIPPTTKTKKERLFSALSSSFEPSVNPCICGKDGLIINTCLFEKIMHYKKNKKAIGLNPQITCLSCFVLFAETTATENIANGKTVKTDSYSAFFNMLMSHCSAGDRKAINARIFKKCISNPVATPSEWPMLGIAKKSATVNKIKNDIYLIKKKAIDDQPSLNEVDLIKAEYSLKDAESAKSKKKRFKKQKELEKLLYKRSFELDMYAKKGLSSCEFLRNILEHEQISTGPVAIVHGYMGGNECIKNRQHAYKDRVNDELFTGGMSSNNPMHPNVVYVYVTGPPMNSFMAEDTKCMNSINEMFLGHISGYPTYVKYSSGHFSIKNLISTIIITTDQFIDLLVCGVPIIEGNHHIAINNQFTPWTVGFDVNGDGYANLIVDYAMLKLFIGNYVPGMNIQCMVESQSVCVESPYTDKFCIRHHQVQNAMRVAYAAK
jgi:hypothetical protein